MNRKRMGKELLAGVAAVALLGGSMGVQKAYADTVAWESAVETVALHDNGESNNLMATKLEWHYKTINGKKYMRLYDAYNERWLTDWILCK